MTLDQLRYFVAAARLQHVTRAATSVAISPSVVSSTISTLEQELHCELFTRKKNRLHLTVEGNRLLKEAESILSKTQNLQKAIHSVKTDLHGKYNLSGSHFLAEHLLIDAWNNVQRKHRSLVAEVLSTDSGTIISNVLNGRLDLGLVFSPMQHPDLSEIRLYEGQFLPTVGKKHPLLKKKRFDLKELGTYPAATYRASQGVNICESHPMFEKFQIDPKHQLFYDNDAVLVKKLADSEAWGLVPDVVVRNFSDKLKALRTPRGWCAPMTISIVRHKKRPLEEPLSLLIEELRKSFVF